MIIKTKNSLIGAINIGSTILKRLNEIGVYSLAELAEMTSVKAYMKICERHSLNTSPTKFDKDEMAFAR